MTSRISRRRLLIATWALIAAPLAGRSQPALPVIGYLGAESAERFASRLNAFRQGLAESGLAEGRNVAIEYRWAEGQNARLPGLAADLVRHRVAVIAAPGSVAAALAAKAASSTVPVVFEIGADPVAVGLVANLNRPGANVTGVTSLNAEVGPKRLQLLHELIPAARSFALLVNPTNPKNAEATTRDMQAAARARALQLHVLHASSEAHFSEAFAELARLRAGGLVIANETFFANRNKELAALALRHAVPAAHQSREFAAAGGLMSYGGNVAESHRLAGYYAGRVLKGEKPAELPVQQVKKVELSINLKTARLLGLTVPQTLLVRADSVIE